MYAVVRTDKMFGTDNRAGIVSVRMPADIENGSVVALGALEEGSREIYTVAEMEVDTPRERVVLIASPEVIYDEHKHNLDAFINAEGSIARGYFLHPNDIFSVTIEALEFDMDEVDEIEVGNIVELVNGYRLGVVASLTPGLPRLVRSSM